MSLQRVFVAQLETDEGLTYSIHRTREGAEARLLGECNAFLVRIWDDIYEDHGAKYSEQGTIKEAMALAKQLDSPIYPEVYECDMED